MGTKNENSHLLTLVRYLSCVKLIDTFDLCMSGSFNEAWCASYWNQILFQCKIWPVINQQFKLDVVQLSDLFMFPWPESIRAPFEKEYLHILLFCVFMRWTGQSMRLAILNSKLVGKIWVVPSFYNYGCSWDSFMLLALYYYYCTGITAGC